MTYAEANKQGILNELLEKKLQTHYEAIRSKNPKDFKNADGEWKKLTGVRNQVANDYFKEILSAINADYAKYEKGEEPIFYAIYRSFGNSDSYTFNPPAGKYYAILLNEGGNDVSFSFKQLEEQYFVKDTTAAVSLILIPFGFFFLIGGLIQKPKKAEIPQKTKG